jgi:acyl-CoA reductase-like NAD-dependent aldehyde dehydrogenase
MKKNCQVYIAGRWRDASSGERFDSINPFSGEAWASLPRCNATDVAEAVEAAHEAYRNRSGAWRQLSPSDRGRLLYKLGALIMRDADRLAKIEVADNGKLITEMRGQLRYIPRWWEYYGGLADKLEGTVLPLDKPGYFAFTRKEPLGVVAAITPWNSPLLLATWKLAPALAAGNTVVLKPSEFTSVSSLELARLVEEAGFPPGVLNVVTGFGDEVGTPLITHPLVAKVAFTGGEPTGRRVYAAAAANLTPALMELGGKSANIVFADAKQEEAVKGAVAGIFAASGQTCIAGSRLLVQRAVHDEFVDRLVTFARRAKLGDPMRDDTQVGPITTAPQRAKVLHYIDVGRREGAEVRLGGGPAEVEGCGSGLFVQPTIFSGVRNDMTIAREEIFGPVLSVIPFEDEDDAVAIANDSPYGLAAGVWTEDARRMLRVSEALEVGTVWVNTYRAVSFMAPFGGRGASGFGRENGLRAIDEYLETKTVWIGTSEKSPDPFAMR